ncbi:hypothetical protein HWV00_21070 (plasmid) [Moritella sp. 24]|uniref:hypothetical protein n=1 Tax=Moritella sp. 24 TaxID=2746230 RepID=UPI001BABECF8|nr:hypothetical protein [Moritella sp. 24]QUM78767.1 hypothetical protein HWV00_21070 [Moritella sp. 24]
MPGSTTTKTLATKCVAIDRAFADVISNIDMGTCVKNLPNIVKDKRYTELLSKYGEFYDRVLFDFFDKDMTGQEMLLVNTVFAGDSTKTCVQLDLDSNDDTWMELQSMLLVSYMVLNPLSRIVIIYSGDNAPAAIYKQMTNMVKQIKILITKMPWIGEYLSIVDSGLKINLPGTNNWRLTFKHYKAGGELKLTGESNPKMLTVLNNAHDCTLDAWRVVQLAQTGCDNKVLAIGGNPIAGTAFNTAIESPNWAKAPLKTLIEA